MASSLDEKEILADGHKDQAATLVTPVDDSVSSYVPGSPEEKALLRKIDYRIVPTLFCLFTMSFLDRANIGNAKTAGMATEFKLTSNQYSVCLLVFFISYTIFAVPSQMILVRCRPSLYISALCVVWGAVAASMAAAKNWSQIALIRFILGAVEAGFAPGVAFYLSSWYRSHEVSRRFNIYFTATAVAGAVGGLIAGLIVQHLDGARGIAAWRWLFLIEGVLSCGIGSMSWIFLPDWPQTSNVLTPAQRILAAQRLATDNLGAPSGEAVYHTAWQSCKAAFREWRVWGLVLIFMGCQGATTIQYFIPTLIANLGYSGFEAQYRTIPLYAVAIGLILITGFTADYFKERPHFLTLMSTMAIIGFIGTVASTNVHVQYGFICLGFGAASANAPLILMWVPQIIPHPAEKRAICLAIVNALGNASSIYGTFLFPSTDAPRYITGFSCTTVFIAIVGIGAQVLRFVFSRYPYPAIDVAGNMAVAEKKAAEVVV